jgi:hypothetical protein
MEYSWRDREVHRICLIKIILVTHLPIAGSALGTATHDQQTKMYGKLDCKLLPPTCNMSLQMHNNTHAIIH